MSIHTLESAYHPKDKLTFLIDWLVTLKCNYDCAYCGLTGHDNSTEHPAYEKAIKMIEQMYRYTDVVMSHKKKYFRDVIMNVYGGESIYHPDIIPLLQATTDFYEEYKDRWRLKRRMTTNGTAAMKNWEQICEHVEGFTMSYHSTGPNKLKKIFRNNLMYLTSIGKEHDVIVCMYPHAESWDDCVEFLRWSKSQGINARPKMLDGSLGVYEDHHLKDLSEFLDHNELKKWDVSQKADTQARGCCGGRKMCINGNLKEYQIMVPRDTNGFYGWQCSANQFFLHANNVTGLYYTNKDCRVKLNGETGPIASIDTMPKYIEDMSHLDKLPTLTCAQKTCRCGTCAPKSVYKENLAKILNNYNHTTSADSV